MSRVVGPLSSGDVCESHDILRKEKADFKLAAQLWILGDHLLTPRYCNDAIHVICYLMGHTLCADMTDSVYNSTVPGSALRRYL